MTSITVIDLGMGNVGSVVNMIRHLERDPVVVSEPRDLRGQRKILLPGVGHFDAAMRILTRGGLDDALRSHVAVGGELLGICLGMQVLLEGSAEGALPGLGLIAGHCERIEPGDGRLRVPHMGWNEVTYDDDWYTSSSADGHWYYFVHSYALRGTNEATVGRTTYGEEFASVIASGGVLGAQFHPEKSHRHGIEFLRAWVDR